MKKKKRKQDVAFQTGTVTVRMPQEMRKWFERQARGDLLSVNLFVGQILVEYMREQDKITYERMIKKLMRDEGENNASEEEK